MPAVRLAVLFLPLALLAGCGGMNRAVGVFPNALDDLAQVRERGSAERRQAPAGTTAPRPR